jgi:hypothetical protein
VHTHKLFLPGSIAECEIFRQLMFHHPCIGRLRDRQQEFYIVQHAHRSSTVPPTVQRMCTLCVQYAHLHFTVVETVRASAEEDRRADELNHQRLVEEARLAAATHTVDHKTTITIRHTDETASTSTQKRSTRHTTAQQQIDAEDTVAETVAVGRSTRTPAFHEVRHWRKKLSQGVPLGTHILTGTLHRSSTHDHSVGGHVVHARTKHGVYASSLVSCIVGLVHEQLSCRCQQ